MEKVCANNMFLLLCRNHDLFAKLSILAKEVSPGQIEQELLSTGASFLKKGNLGVVLLPENNDALKESYHWLYQRQMIEAAILTDFCEYIGLGKVDKAFLIPHKCFRQAGRLDIGFAPILYEEMHFDESTQDFIWGCTESKTNRPKQLLFSSTGKTNTVQNEWLFSNLNCLSVDNWSGQALQVFSKSLQVKVGCLLAYSSFDDIENQYLNCIRIFIEKIYSLESSASPQTL